MPDDEREAAVQRNAAEIMDAVRKHLPAHWSPKRRRATAMTVLSRLKEVADEEGLIVMPLDRARVVIGVACWDIGNE